MSAAPRLIASMVAEAAQGADELEQLRGKRLLLTGGTGFFGTWLLETIAWLNDRWNEPCRVFVPTRDVAAFARKAPHLARRPDVTLVTGDVATFDYPDTHCAFIIHAAAPASPHLSATEPIAVGETIVAGTRHVLEVARRLQVERLLFLSSGAVYGVQPPTLEQVPEDYMGAPDIRTPRSAYGEAKRYSEVLCLAYLQRYGMPITIARPFTTIGPYQALDDGFAVTDFIRDGLRSRRITVRGDGTSMRSYCAAPDVVRALFGILLRGHPGRAYNVGSDESISILDVARRVARTLDNSSELTVMGQPTPGNLPARYVPDISRIATELGLRPRIALDASLAHSVAWAREHLETSGHEPGNAHGT